MIMQMQSTAYDEGYDPYGSTIEQPLISQVMNALLRFKWLILGIVAASLILGAIVTLLATPLYSAATRLEISREQANVTNVENLEPSESMRNQEFYETQYALLQSKTLAERVAKQLDLANNADFLNMAGLGDSVLNTGANATQADRAALEKAIVTN